MKIIVLKNKQNNNEACTQHSPLLLSIFFLSYLSLLIICGNKICKPACLARCSLVIMMIIVFHVPVVSPDFPCVTKMFVLIFHGLRKC